MASPKMMLSEFAWDDAYRLTATDEVLTPALVVYPDAIAANIECTLRLLHGDASRWRVHIKTAKLAYTLRMYVDRGVGNFKCATTLELLTACRNGASDVLLAYPVMGANAQRAREIAASFPRVRISVLAENVAQLEPWRGSRVGVFLDINSGMNRTGIEHNHREQIAKLARVVCETALEFRGLHFYDGHLGGIPEPERTRVAQVGYDALLEIVREVEEYGTSVPEVITAGTPSLPCSVAYVGFQKQGFVHRVSPGTVIYNDATSLVQLDAKLGYRPAALVLTRVVSSPRPGVATCDAGHKSVSADAGVPTCIVLGHPELTALTPSEEHLPLAIRDGATGPRVGDTLLLLPRHVCPTVNNFDHAVIVRDGRVLSIESVSARGREAPLASLQEAARQ